MPHDDDFESRYPWERPDWEDAPKPLTRGETARIWLAVGAAMAASLLLFLAYPSDLTVVLLALAWNPLMWPVPSLVKQMLEAGERGDREGFAAARRTLVPLLVVSVGFCAWAAFGRE